MKSSVARPPLRSSYPHVSPHRLKTTSTWPSSTASCTISSGAATRRTPSPSYFALAVDSESDPTNSYVGPKDNWSSPTSSIRSFGPPSPVCVPLVVDPSLDAFRRQAAAARGNPSSPVHGNLSPAIVSSPPTSTCLRPGDAVTPGSRSLFDILPTHLESASSISLPATADQAEQQSALSREGGERPWLSSSSVEEDTRRADAGRETHRRAQTLPTTLEVKPVMLEPDGLKDILETAAPHQFLLLDLRVSPLFAKLRIKGALNLCIPTTLLKRPSFTLEKISRTFQDENERARFSKWRDCRYVIVYDAHSRDERSSPSAVYTIKKFTQEGWHGRAYILTGGIDEFSQVYPQLVEQQQESPRKLFPTSHVSDDVTLLAGGCTMPPVQGAANPLFSNIRQVAESLDGVGRLNVVPPKALDFGADAFLPQWLRAAAAPGDQGKIIADKFFRIEQDELARMQKALSARISSTASGTSSEGNFQIAGIEKGGKNRYNNIWPFEHARVRLQGRPDGACDYVNASHLKTRWSNKRYIASQGPLPATFEDFWSVIWDQDIRVIVMLTAESEGGQLKCHPYWAGKEYGSFRLKALSERKVSLDRRRRRESTARQDSDRWRADARIISPPATSSFDDQPFVVIRKFALSRVSEPFSPIREITQLQYGSWPDFGTPAQPSHLLSLVELSDAQQRVASGADSRESAENVRPLLVHCSAGCGRTGTFCTIDSVIDMLKRQQQEQKGGVKHTGNTRRSASNGGSHAGGGEQIGVSDDWIFSDKQDLIQKAVEDFRRQRISMVQGLRQYVLCYETVLEWVSQQQQAWRHEKSGKESRE